MRSRCRVHGCKARLGSKALDRPSFWLVCTATQWMSRVLSVRNGEPKPSKAMLVEGC